MKRLGVVSISRLWYFGVYGFRFLCLGCVLTALLEKGPAVSKAQLPLSKEHPCVGTGSGLSHTLIITQNNSNSNDKNSNNDNNQNIIDNDSNIIIPITIRIARSQVLTPKLCCAHSTQSRDQLDLGASFTLPGTSFRVFFFFVSW